MTADLWLWSTDALLLIIAFLAGRMSINQKRSNDLRQLQIDTEEALRRVDELERLVKR